MTKIYNAIGVLFLFTMSLHAGGDTYADSRFDYDFAARAKYGVEATDEIAKHYKLPPKITLAEKDWYLDYRYQGQLMLTPMGQIGALGASVKGQEGLIIYQTETACAAARGGLKKWDRITAINGQKIGTLDAQWHTGEGPIAVFGNELYRCESIGESLALQVLRDGKEHSLIVDIEQRKNDETFLNELLDKIAAAQGKSGTWESAWSHTRTYASTLMSLTLLNGGNPKHLPAVRKSIDQLLKNKSGMEWTWLRTMSVVLMAEYVAASGDLEIVPELQKWSDMLAYDYTNVHGGLGHKVGAKGTYGEKSFGASAVMANFAWALAEKAGCRINSRVRDLNLKYLRDNSELSGRVYVDYRGKVKSRKLTNKRRNQDEKESGFRNALLTMALKLSGCDNTLQKSLLDTLIANQTDLCYTHSLPSHGMIFGTLAFAACDDKLLTKHLDYRKWFMAISRMPDNSIHYVTPKLTRYVLPYGGGWDGDSHVGRRNMAYAQYVFLLSAHKKNLIMSGKKQLGWLAGKDSEKVAEDIKNIHEKMAQEILKEANKLSDETKYHDAVVLYEKLLDSYQPFLATTEAKRKIKFLKSKPTIWTKVTEEKRQAEAQAYLKAANGIKNKVTHFQELDFIMSHFPNTEAAKTAQAELLKYAIEAVKREAALEQKETLAKKKEIAAKNKAKATKAKSEVKKDPAKISQ